MRVPLSGLTEGLLVDAEEVSVGKLKRISGDIAAAYFAGDGGISAEFILRDAVVRHPEMRDAALRQKAVEGPDEVLPRARVRHAHGLRHFDHLSFAGFAVREEGVISVRQHDEAGSVREFRMEAAHGVLKGVG